MDEIYRLQSRSGFAFPDRKKLRNIDRTEAIKELGKFMNKNPNKPITVSSYDAWEGRQYKGRQLGQLSFGSWAELCRAANVPWAKRRPTDLEVIEYYDKVCQHLGGQPSRDELDEYYQARPDKFCVSVGVIQRRWGALSIFAKLFMFYKNGKISLEELLAKKAGSRGQMAADKLGPLNVPDEMLRYK